MKESNMESLLKNAIRALLSDMPSYGCNELHHAKKDRHTLFEPCPVKERLDKTIEYARKLVEPNT